ncbi:MAG: DUF3572 domain-containing protein [Rhodomicrobiaceae bacterium]
MRTDAALMAAPTIIVAIVMPSQFPKQTDPRREDAEQLAIAALTFLAADETRLSAFVASTGYDLAGIRAEAASSGFLAGVLDFLLNDESLLLVFAGHMSIDPARIAAARRALLPNQANSD